MTGARVLFFSMAAALTLGTGLPVAANSNYQRVSIGEEISIEVPKHWIVHSNAENKNFAAAAEASSRGEGINNESAGDKNTLLAVSALPTPSGAKIRISVVRPPDFTRADLTATTSVLSNVRRRL